MTEPDTIPTGQDFPASPASLNSFFQWFRNLEWTRSDQRWIGGICSSIATRTGWDTNLVRGVVVVMTPFFWFPIPLYAAAWLLLPDSRNGKIGLEELFAGRVEPPQVVAGIALILGVLNPIPWAILAAAPWFWGISALFIMFLGITFLLATRNQERETRTPQRPPNRSPQEAFTMSSNQANLPQSQKQSPNQSPNYPQGFYMAPQPAPSYYYAPPFGPQPPIPLKPNPVMSSRIGLLVLGALALLAASFLMIAMIGGMEYYQTRSLFVVGAAISLITIGLTLGIAATHGKRGGWFFGISLAAALILVPAGVSTANQANYPSAYDGYGNQYFYTPEDFAQLDSIPAAPIYEIQSGDVAESSQSGAVESVDSGIHNFDHTSPEINATSSMILIDLTGAPSNYWKEIPVTAESSMVTIMIREDQPLNLESIGESSDIRLSNNNASLTWLPDNWAGDFELESHSPNYLVNKDGINLKLDLYSSEVNIIISSSAEPTSGSTPSPTPNGEKSNQQANEMSGATNNE